MSDVSNIEFLDLSDVDESEQIRVRTSLRHNDPSVQLPWVKNNSNILLPGIKQVKKKKEIKHNDSSRNISANHDYIHPTVSSTPVVNNVYLNQDQQFHQPAVVIPPLVTSDAGHHQPNPVYYANALSPVSSTYPHQVYVIPQSTIGNVIHNYPNKVTYPYTSSATVYPYAVTTQPIHIHNNVITNSHALMEPQLVQQQNYENGILPSSVAEHTLILNENSNVVESSTAVNIMPTQGPVIKTNIDSTSEGGVASQSVPSSSLVIENGIENKSVKETTNSSSSANKSWASLFNSGKSNNDVNNQSADNGMEKVIFDKAVNKESNNIENICPIKHPRRSPFVDPDCYRMGEYLISYSIDGRATSLQPRGLINQSNYCYINSILQALVACPPLYNLLNGLSQNISSNEKRKPTPVIDGMCRFVKEFTHLPANMRVNHRRSEGKNQKKDQGIIINTDIPFQPSWIYKMLNGIRTDLIEGRQEDAEEFLGCLLNGLNDEMLELIKLVKNDLDEPHQLTNNCQHENGLDKEWQVMGPKNKGSITRRTDFGRTPISDIFGGFLKSRIHRTGDHVTENIQPFFTLQLNIEKVKTVREALEALVTKYQLEGLTSSKTNEEVEAWQQVMLDELPIILVLHLKCFDFKLDGCKKIIKALDFPIDLKIDAMVYHDGKEASKGHYVTDAFHVGYSSWLRYDDASVKPVQEEHVLKPQGTRVPYLLFYRRSDTIRSK
ncbi:hypothetical protein NQ314_003955 [Rhamnusium bicolor]|uniref:ubiquitinyl hydrolase 1 n=1 Tax=Rhamnusium bicolor TaxID=1586634 RepID=A0AAV8ZNF2_9CUCU|nr:hypothetical protein NQ314_003955 [Rhamnusium bicolor]